jgi:hypothetical protein
MLSGREKVQTREKRPNEESNFKEAEVSGLEPAARVLHVMPLTRLLIQYTDQNHKMSFSERIMYSHSQA